LLVFAVAAPIGTAATGGNIAGLAQEASSGAVADTVIAARSRFYECPSLAVGTHTET